MNYIYRCAQQTNRIRECKKLKDVRRLCNGIDNFKNKVTSKHLLPYKVISYVCYYITFTFL